MKLLLDESDLNDHYKDLSFNEVEAYCFNMHVYTVLSHCAYVDYTDTRTNETKILKNRYLGVQS